MAPSYCRRRLPFGLDAIDERLPGGGIAAAHCTRWRAAPTSPTTHAPRSSSRASWRASTDPCSGGLHPDRVIHVEEGSDANVLLAMEECLRHAGLAGVVGEIGKHSTTASKRLQLAAEGSGVSAFVFRRASRTDHDIEGTAAVPRWRITAEPSEDLGIPSLGPPRWRVALERVRGGNPHIWILEGCDAQGSTASMGTARRCASAQRRHHATTPISPSCSDLGSRRSSLASASRR